MFLSHPRTARDSTCATRSLQSYSACMCLHHCGAQQIIFITGFFSGYLTGINCAPPSVVSGSPPQDFCTPFSVGTGSTPWPLPSPASLTRQKSRFAQRQHYGRPCSTCRSSCSDKVAIKKHALRLKQRKIVPDLRGRSSWDYNNCIRHCA